MAERTILGKTIHEAPRRLIAGADCWLSDDERWIVGSRRELNTNLYRWKAEEGLKMPDTNLVQGVE